MTVARKTIVRSVDRNGIGTGYRRAETSRGKVLSIEMFTCHADGTPYRPNGRLPSPMKAGIKRMREDPDLAGVVAELEAEQAAERQG